MTKHRILSIDGGGIKGVFPASFLAEVEKALSLKSVANYFDLIAGTSVGGIVALGLGMGLSAQAIAAFLVEQGPDIFPQDVLPTNTLKLLCGRNRYNPKPLRNALDNVFGTKVLANSKTRLLIPTFDASQGNIHIYKTAHNQRLKMDYRVRAVDVAMATAAAPTYFPAYDSSSKLTFVDGGLFANDPIALAVVEGISMLGWAGTDIEVLSIGCTDEPLDFTKHWHHGWYWLRNAIEAAMRGQSLSAQGMAKHLTGREKGLDNVVRINQTVAPRRFKLDSPKGTAELQGLGYSAARHALPDIQNRFFGSEAEAFVSMKTE